MTLILGQWDEKKARVGRFSPFKQLNLALLWADPLQAVQLTCRSVELPVNLDFDLIAAVLPG